MFETGLLVLSFISAATAVALLQENDETPWASVAPGAGIKSGLSLSFFDHQKPSQTQTHQMSLSKDLGKSPKCPRDFKHAADDDIEESSMMLMMMTLRFDMIHLNHETASQLFSCANLSLDNLQIPNLKSSLTKMRRRTEGE